MNHSWEILGVENAFSMAPNIQEWHRASNYCNDTYYSTLSDFIFDYLMEDKESWEKARALTAVWWKKLTKEERRKIIFTKLEDIKSLVKHYQAIEKELEEALQEYIKEEKRT